ncbi:MAG: hypothetical protein F6K40_19095 [Okeania sp. SIO3I5]|uniref:hypothetical protein n=1 Tax=Okeania sp. SIO3I5 TaxID=2607805 RepID=UPI0013B6B392|nr:hypothetical protein [Okeania sp. SIO3I5]NEQ38253.1 hypothetical protein [Okeania sp. SIO3I5]
MSLILTKSEFRIQKSEVIFVTGIRATLQKYFADQGGVLDPILFDNLAEVRSYDPGGKLKAEDCFAANSCRGA